LQECAQISQICESLPGFLPATQPAGAEMAFCRFDFYV
jgi:hypothetical protein